MIKFEIIKKWSPPNIESKKEQILLQIQELVADAVMIRIPSKTGNLKKALEVTINNNGIDVIFNRLIDPQAEFKLAKAKRLGKDFLQEALDEVQPRVLELLHELKNYAIG
jgi:hypothetical protein